MKSFKAAKSLVKHRRLEVARKFSWLFLVLLLGVSLIVIPVIAFIPFLAEVIYFALTVCLLPVILGYIYEIYKAML